MMPPAQAISLDWCKPLVQLSPRALRNYRASSNCPSIPHINPRSPRVLTAPMPPPQALVDSAMGHKSTTHCHSPMCKTHAPPINDRRSRIRSPAESAARHCSCSPSSMGGSLPSACSPTLSQLSAYHRDTRSVFSLQHSSPDRLYASSGAHRLPHYQYTLWHPDWQYYSWHNSQ